MTDLNARLVALSTPDSPLAQACAAAFEREGAQIIPLMDDTAAEFVKTHPMIDIFLLFLPDSPVIDTLYLNDSAWERAVTAPLQRNFQLIREIGTTMISRQKGVIVVSGGLSGLTGFPGWTAASALQGALVAMIRSLACEWAVHNVRVLYMANGAVDGEPLLTAPASPLTVTQNAIERTPLKRSATSEEIAQIVLYLASDRASFLTGSPIRADGGWTSWGLLK
jgi:NAD(P)-dependent dehydrogenase (short-subunit alcohol dehydrogenase family)